MEAEAEKCVGKCTECAPDCPARIVDHDADTDRYFSLIVQAAQVTAQQRPDDTDPDEFWRDRIHKEYVHVNSVLGDSGLHVSRMPSPMRAEFMSSALGRLARECLMAAWYFGMWELEGNDDPEYAEFSAAETVKRINAES